MNLSVSSQMPEFSIIIPVYNRPDELRELLHSLSCQTNKNFEVIVVEDGSDNPSDKLVGDFRLHIPVLYLTKANSGPGPSRNFGAQRASGNWLIFLDSDCIMPENYLAEVEKAIKLTACDAFGGPDNALPSFSSWQKAVNYSMTSALTTGGIRGGKKRMEKFKPRSFNMGVKQTAFSEIGGFSAMRYGEDIDLSIRLEKAGYTSVLIEQAFAFHKRRSSIREFFRQVTNSGRARVLLGNLHPGSTKLVHYLPVAFLLFVMASLLSLLIYPWAVLPLFAFMTLIFLHSSLVNKDLIVGLCSVVSSVTQLAGYGFGFISALIKKPVSSRENEN